MALSKNCHIRKIWCISNRAMNLKSHSQRVKCLFLPFTILFAKLFLSLFLYTPSLVQFCIAVYLECHTKQLFLQNMSEQRSINAQKAECGYLLLYHLIYMRLHQKKFCFWENDSTSTNFQLIIPLWYQYVKICCESRNINLESVHHLSYIISLYVYLYLFIYPHLSPSICYCKIVLRNINWSHNFPR